MANHKNEIELEPNVRLLNSGAWGYIHEGKAIFRSENAEMVNEFARHVRKQKLEKQIGISGAFVVSPIKIWANEWQKLEGEPKILPQCHLCDAAIWRVEGNNYESQIKVPTF